MHSILNLDRNDPFPLILCYAIRMDGKMLRGLPSGGTTALNSRLRAGCIRLGHDVRWRVWGVGRVMTRLHFWSQRMPSFCEYFDRRPMMGSNQDGYICFKCIVSLCFFLAVCERISMLNTVYCCILLPISPTASPCACIRNTRSDR